jgi:hypothetical protein
MTTLGSVNAGFRAAEAGFLNLPRCRNPAICLNYFEETGTSAPSRAFAVLV